MPGQLTLITGAVRSGKSRFAERLARDLAGDHPVTYLATSRIWDDEMAARVADHKASRPAAWRTVEEPLALSDTLAAVLAQPPTTVLVESLDMWVSNRLLDSQVTTGGDNTQLDSARVAELERGLLAEVHAIVSAQRASITHLVVVTVEAGWGVVPPYPLGRAFRDLLGRVNAAVAERADAVYLMVAGLPVDVKRLAVGGA